MSDEHHVGSADTEHDQHTIEKLGYEARDIIGNRRTIFYFAALHFGGLIGAGVLVYGIYFVMASFAPKFDGPDNPGGQIASVAAKIQPHPGPDMDAYLHKATDRLHNYGWVDEATGTAHIPIDKAIDKTAEMDLPYRSEVPE
ncbi:MAG: hypothetical protein ABIV13_06170 [Fimbriimonadales bacterium]